MEGRLLDCDEDDERTSTASAKSRSRLSYFFRSIHVEFSQPTIRNGSMPIQPVEWKKPEKVNQPPTAHPSPLSDFDEFAFRRPGDHNLNIKIVMHRHESPDRFRFSQALTDVIDMSEGTREEAQFALWEYIRVFGLQEDDDRRNFRLDGPLRRVSNRVVPRLWRLDQKRHLLMNSSLLP